MTTKLEDLKPGDKAVVCFRNHKCRQTTYTEVTVGKVLKTQIVLEDGRRYQRNTGFWSGVRSNMGIVEEGVLPVYATSLKTTDDPYYLDSLHSAEYQKAERATLAAWAVWLDDPSVGAARRAITAMEAWIAADNADAVRQLADRADRICEDMKTVVEEEPK